MQQKRIEDVGHLDNRSLSEAVTPPQRALRYLPLSLTGIGQISQIATKLFEVEEQ